MTTSSPCPARSGLPSSANLLSVFDVYDIAATIGKDFETIIDQYGPGTVCTLMPKVIHVLEELEDYASRLETQESELATLQTAVDRFELEKLDRIQERLRLEEVNACQSVFIVSLFQYMSECARVIHLLKSV